jgi:hypothetical protein
LACHTAVPGPASAPALVVAGAVAAGGLLFVLKLLLPGLQLLVFLLFLLTGPLLLLLELFLG